MAVPPASLRAVPLVVTADPVLLEEVVRLAAAAGVSPEVATDVGAGLRGWPAASLVLVGADLALDLAALGPKRRDGVHVLTWGEPAPALYAAALALGAEGVAELPHQAPWIGGLLGDAADPTPARGVTIGVLPGSGGAGATTFACALGQLAARHGPTLVMDADPLGPGADRVLGLEDRDGIRWGELGQTTGRLGARSLREAVPRSGDLGVLTWAPATGREVAPEVVREALAAARRGHDLVVVDLPRTVSAGTEELVARCDHVLVLVTASVTGIAAAARLVARLPDRSRLRLVVRGRGADPDVVAQATGALVLATMSDQRGLSESIDLGLGPVRSRRGPLGRTSALVLSELAVAA